MIRLIDGASAQLESLPENFSEGKLSALLEWALRVRLGGGLPFLHLPVMRYVKC